MESTAPSSTSAYRPPVGVVLPRPSVARRAARIAEAVASGTRHLGPVGVRRVVERRLDTMRAARGLRAIFDDLGGTYLKLGQLMASAPGVFGEEESAQFRDCLDRAPAVPFDAVRRVVEDGLGERLEDAFASFEPEHLACASIAVVHRGVLHDGTPVAVKVLRPGIEESVAADLESMRPLFGFLAKQGFGPAIALSQLLFGFREQLAEELDLRNEALAMAHFREVFEQVGLSRIAIPHVHRATRSVLIMELLDGSPIDNPEQLGDLAPDPAALLEELVRAWLLTALRDGVFHADVHAGNLMLLRDGRLGLIDWGIVGRLDPKTHTYFRRIIEGSLGDEAAWDDVADYMTDMIESAGGKLDLSKEERAQLIKAMVQPMLTQPFGAVGLSSLMMSREKAQEIIGRELGPRPRRTPIERLRRRRSLARALDGDGRVDQDAFRSNFLLAKQILYVEGYGKRFLRDSAILSDPEFLRRVLDGSDSQPS